MLAKITAQVIEDAPAAPASDKAELRVVHLSADTPEVDVFAGADKVVTGLAYPKATGYLSVPGATYQVKVCASADNRVCPIGPVALTPENGKAHSVFAVGSLAAATAPAPQMTAPPTDTIAASGSDAPSSGLGLGLAALLAAATTLLLGVRLSARTARR